jgi:hypothetical protein
LCEGDKILDAAMAKADKMIPAGDALVRAGEPHGTVYRLTTGKMVRVTRIDDGRRQIICMFLPGDLLALKGHRQVNGIRLAFGIPLCRAGGSTLVLLSQNVARFSVSG